MKMSSDTEMSNPWIVCCLVSLTFQVFRLSIDSIQTASQSTSKDYAEDHHNSTKEKSSKAKLDRDVKSYGSIDTLRSNRDVASDELEVLVPESGRDSRPGNPMFQLVPSRHKATVWSFRIQVLLALLLFLCAVAQVGAIMPNIASWAAFGIVVIGALLTYRDVERQRLGVISRVCYLAAVVTLWIPICTQYYKERDVSVTGDELILNTFGLYFLLALSEALFLDFPQRPAGGEEDSGELRKKSLSRAAIITLLKPYFWPDQTSDSATINRIRAVLTWVCVILSKVCNLVAPMFLGWASTALAHEEYSTCIGYSVAYAVIQFFGATFKEGQSLIYLKVAQAAFVQLSETTFIHLHTLSLDWHLRKKLGEVIRSMDRGIAAW